MSRLIKRLCTEVTFIENVSEDANIRTITLKLDNEGAGRFLVLSNGSKGSDFYFDDPEDIGRIYETAKQLWAQGDVAVLGDSTEPQELKPVKFIDSVSGSYRKIT